MTSNFSFWQNDVEITPPGQIDKVIVYGMTSNFNFSRRRILFLIRLKSFWRNDVEFAPAQIEKFIVSAEWRRPSAVKCFMTQ